MGFSWDNNDYGPQLIGKVVNLSIWRLPDEPSKGVPGDRIMGTVEMIRVFGDGTLFVFFRGGQQIELNPGSCTWVFTEVGY